VDSAADDLKVAPGVEVRAVLLELLHPDAAELRSLVAILDLLLLEVAEMLLVMIGSAARNSASMSSKSSSA
jgi:uncharacterized protein YhhL (DUF1145 family)